MRRSKVLIMVAWVLLTAAVSLQAQDDADRTCALQDESIKRTLCLTAKMLPNDPPFAADPHLVIGDDEILRAIEIWVKGDGKVLMDDPTILAAVALWVQGASWHSYR